MMKIIVKPLFTQFKSITIELSFIFNKIKSYLKKVQISDLRQKCLDFSKIMSRILTFWNSGHI